jgi:prepilin-type N-terminal cleavage/methylation domain-containing protein
MLVNQNLRDHKGFTLIEIIATTIIIGLLATASVMGFDLMIKRAYIKDAFLNLLTIYHIQQNYFRVNGDYYDGSNLPDLNANLKTNIVKVSNVEYKCRVSGTEKICFIEEGGNERVIVDLTLPILNQTPVYCNNNKPNGTYNPCCKRTGTATAGTPCS